MKNIFRKILTWKTVEVILIIILLVVIPQIQSHYMNQYIAENQFKALNNTKEQVAIARTINSMKNWQMVFVYNFV